MAKRTSKYLMTPRTLILRINRKLGAESKKLKAVRNVLAREQLGDFYVIDIGINAITEKHVDPIDLGHRLGVLADWEAVAE